MIRLEALDTTACINPKYSLNVLDTFENPAPLKALEDPFSTLLTPRVPGL